MRDKKKIRKMHKIIVAGFTLGVIGEKIEIGGFVKIKSNFVGSYIHACLIENNIFDEPCNNT